jgi:hypothetical protein
MLMQVLLLSLAGTFKSAGLVCEPVVEEESSLEDALLNYTGCEDEDVRKGAYVDNLENDEGVVHHVVARELPETPGEIDTLRRDIVNQLGQADAQMLVMLKMVLERGISSNPSDYYWAV